MDVCLPHRNCLEWIPTVGLTPTPEPDEHCLHHSPVLSTSVYRGLLPKFPLGHRAGVPPLTSEWVPYGGAAESGDSHSHEYLIMFDPGLYADQLLGFRRVGAWFHPLLTCL